MGSQRFPVHLPVYQIGLSDAQKISGLRKRLHSSFGRERDLSGLCDESKGSGKRVPERKPQREAQKGFGHTFIITSLQNNESKKIRAKVKKISRLLERHYGIPRRQGRGDPLDILIETILSQNTNDRNRDRAYLRLKNRFPRWENVLGAKIKSIVSAIRPGGLAEQKARRIHEILHWIQEREGRLSLSFLKKMDSEEIEKTIGALKGIGPKTIHCLLLFGLGKDVFPVDTHILRIGKRLGFIPERMNAEKAHPWMVPFIPKKKSLLLHLNLIRFGREICRAKKPQCDICFIKRECTTLGVMKT
jgi:endonuclease-3